MLDDPIGQRTFEANVATGLFRLDPFVLQNLFTFRLKFPIKRRVLQQFIRRERLFRFVRHNRESNISLAHANLSSSWANDNRKVLGDSIT